MVNVIKNTMVFWNGSDAFKKAVTRSATSWVLRLQNEVAIHVF